MFFGGGKKNAEKNGVLFPFRRNISYFRSYNFFVLKNDSVFMYSYLRERIKHAVRFRHKRGFGVHSPFMFNLILNVIRDKEKKFNYPEEAEHNRKIRLKQRKLYRLICRLVCFLNVDYVLCFSAHSGDILAYLSGSAARKEANQPRFMREAVLFISVRMPGPCYRMW